jgi:hypothetical protein
MQRGQTLLLKLGMATVRMLECWKKKCGETNANLAEQCTPQRCKFENGNAMNSVDAFKLILGKEAAKGLPMALAQKLQSGSPTEEALEDAKAFARQVGETVLNEVECWKKQCSGTRMDLQDLMLDIKGGSAEIDIDLSDSYGGGSEC